MCLWRVSWVGAAGRLRIHVHGYSHRPQVADTHNTANHVSSQVIKDQDLPDGVAIGVENGCHWGKEAVCEHLFSLASVDRLVEVENLFERSYKKLARETQDTVYPSHAYQSGDRAKSFLWSPCSRLSWRL